MTSRSVSVALLLVGLAAGTVADRPRVAEPVQLGPYRVLEADFHVHSFFGDGILSPFNVVLEARRRGLHAFALTNHNQVFAAHLARWFSRRIDGPTVLVGEEITRPEIHLIAAGIERTVDWRQSAKELISDVHSQGGVVIAAHPVKVFWPAFTDEVVAKLDGAERMHPLVYTIDNERDDLPVFFERARKIKPRLAAIGSSDFHFFNLFGTCRTYLFVTEPGEAGVLDAIRAGRTVVFDVDDEPVGDPEMIALLRSSSFDRKTPTNEPLSAFELFARACGWLGLLGLVVLGRSRESRRL